MYRMIMVVSVMFCAKEQWAKNNHFLACIATVDATGNLELLSNSTTDFKMTNLVVDH